MTNTIEILPQLPPIGLGHVLHAMSSLCKNKYSVCETDWFTSRQIRDEWYTKIIRPIESAEELSHYRYRSNGKAVDSNFLSKYPKVKQTVQDPEWFWQPQVKNIERYLIPQMQVVLPDHRDEAFPNQELNSIIYDICHKMSDAERRTGIQNPMYWGTRWYQFSTREKGNLLREAGGILFEIKDEPEKKYKPTGLGHKYGMYPTFWNIGPEMYHVYLKPITVTTEE